MKDLANSPLDSAHSGVYAAPATTRVLEQQAAACGLEWLELDLTGVADKAGLLARCQRLFKLPPSFGHNWDALADSLQDLSWLPARGYVVSCRNGGELARRSPEDFSTALAILAATASYWRSKGKPFIVLLDAEAGRRCKPEPPPFPA